MENIDLTLIEESLSQIIENDTQLLEMLQRNQEQIHFIYMIVIVIAFILFVQMIIKR